LDGLLWRHNLIIPLIPLSVMRASCLCAPLALCARHRQRGIGLSLFWCPWFRDAPLWATLLPGLRPCLGASTDTLRSRGRSCTANAQRRCVLPITPRAPLQITNGHNGLGGQSGQRTPIVTAAWKSEDLQVMNFWLSGAEAQIFKGL